MERPFKYPQSLPADAVAIPEYPRYFATPSGAIYSLIGCLKRRRFSLNGVGYPTIGMVHESGAKRFVIVHRIIARLFVPGDHSLTVDHIDENKQNCAASNLQWVTLSENHKRAHALHPERGNATGLRVSKALLATCPHTGDEHLFESGKAAAIWVGNPLAAGNISKACVHGRAAYGFHWRKA